MRKTVAVLGLAAFITTFTLFEAAAQQKKSRPNPVRERLTSAKYDDIHGRQGNGPAFGTMAPDFELMPLKFYELGLDDADITKENAGQLYKPVRLSDFQGVKPVVLIFGSYT